ncbi:MAG: helix-hairpin-helix domain-containing protein [Planctomycetaceae bacterium]|jgi:uncharacterized protein|nr:helix-hairpin-helix domain-containing protein [Planctomycetaceae bacterium]
MVEPITINVRYLAQDVRLPQEQVQSVVDLLDAGMPVSFIARYRRDMTKNLNEELLRQIEEALRDARALSERKMTILKTLEAAGKLTPELDQNFREAKSIKRLEDLYLPHKPKRPATAAAAKNLGLEPLAQEILEGTVPPEKLDERAAEFINPDKNVKSVADALLGAGHIIADIFAGKPELVHRVREFLYQHGHLVTSRNPPKYPAAEESRIAGSDQPSKNETPQNEEPANEPPKDEEPVNELSKEDPPETVISASSESEEAASPVSETSESPESPETEVTEMFQQIQEAQAEKGIPKIISQNTLKKKKREEEKKKQIDIKARQREHFERQFTDYFHFSTKLRGIPAHKILAFNRGERHKILNVTIEADVNSILESVKELCIPAEHVHAPFLTGCLNDALQKLVVPALAKEARTDMTEYAEKHTIRSFARNLRNLLLQRPLPNRRVLAIAPVSKQDSKHGCKAAALDEFGNLLASETVFLAGNAERREHTAQVIAEMIRKYQSAVIAVGNGPGSRDVEEMVAKMLAAHFADADLSYVMVNDAGAGMYAVSPAAKEEFPNEDPFICGAISIGRRLQDALKELVKIEPASLGSGIYYHDVKGKYLKQMLAEVVESCVNFVGTDLNSATAALLGYIAGLNPMTAKRICEYRREHGLFKNRADLKSVPGINETVYHQAAGFLRITGGDNPLDATNIHPESYELAAGILEKLGFTTDVLRTAEGIKQVADKVYAEKIETLSARFSEELHAGPFAVRSVLQELCHPGRDPREKLPMPVMKRHALQFAELTPGQPLSGTVQNVTEFGAFVDIGLPESGFVHVSQMSTGYLRDAHDRTAVGDMVHVWVTEIDSVKKRVSLTLLPPGQARRQPSSPKQKGEERPQRDPVKNREAAEVPHEKVSPEPASDRRSFDRRQFESSRSKPEQRGRGNNAKDREHSSSDKSRNNSSFRKDDRLRDRVPKTFESAPVKKEVKPITEKMKQGKEPMRSFADLAQLFEQTKTDES